MKKLAACVVDQHVYFPSGESQGSRKGGGNSDAETRQGQLAGFEEGDELCSRLLDGLLSDVGEAVLVRDGLTNVDEQLDQVIQLL